MKAIFNLSFATLWVCFGCSSQLLEQQASNVPDEGKAQKSLGQFECLAGTKFQIAAIQSSNEGGYFSKSHHSNIYNYLFMDIVNASFRKLLDTNDIVIAQTLKLYDSAPKDNSLEDSNLQNQCSIDGPKIRWLLYTILKEDTNKNKNLDIEDFKTIAVSDAEGKNYTELITNVREVYGQAYQPKLDRLTIVYRSDRVKQASIIDLSTKKIISKKSLPNLGTDVN